MDQSEASIIESRVINLFNLVPSSFRSHTLSFLFVPDLW